jgi:hypothetical protein
MNMSPSLRSGIATFTSISIVLSFGAAAPGRSSPVAPADPGPVFSHPLIVTNPYANFPTIGATGAKVMFSSPGWWETTTYPERTRTFDWNGQKVECRVVVEEEVEDGQVVETSENYLAQADDGSVYCFGDCVKAQAPTQAKEPSWLLGGPSQPGDPSNALSASNPMLFMPSHPRVLSDWMLADLPPVFEDSATVISAPEQVDTPCGSFTEVLAVQVVDAAGECHIKFYAPAIGEVLELRRDGMSVLVALNISR